MRFPVAVLMVGLGYGFVYWALMRIFAFGPSDGTPQNDLDHAVARLSVLLGLPNASKDVIAQPPVHIGQKDFGSPASNTNPGQGGATFSPGGSGGMAPGQGAPLPGPPTAGGVSL